MSTTKARRAGALLLALSTTIAACSAGSDDSEATAPTTAATEPDAVDDAFAALEEDLDDLNDSVDDLGSDEPATTAPPTTEAPTTEAPTTADSGESDDFLSSEVAIFNLNDLQIVTSDMVGPTDDVSATARQLGLFPDAPTMPGTSVIGMLFEVDMTEISAFHRNSIEVWSAASFEDTMTFYETELTALGYEITDLSTSTSGDAEGGNIRTTLPDEGDLTARALNIIVQTGTDGVGTTARLSGLTSEPPADQLARFNLWAATAPIPDGGMQTGVSISVTPVGPRNAPREYWANTAVDWTYVGVNEQDLRGQVGQLLEDSSAYRLDGDLTSFTVNLASDLFPKGASLTFQQSGNESFLMMTGKWDIPAT